MQDKYITVTQLTRYIKYKIDNDEHLQLVFLKGEISNFKAHTRGHFYFSIKDENTKINAIMFQSNASKINFIPMDGMKVLLVGRISLYEATGSYQIYVEEMLEDGVGNLYVKYEQLKKKLDEEGLFDPLKKKKIPKFPLKIGIVTASTGAAIKDILSTIKRRWPIAETILFPSLVQGELAANDIVKQITVANNFDIDVLIVGRGGGSIEDMWCFNEEVVARAIYNSKIPVISAVGHEIDFTIADFVADLRAPTPTGAAEIATPNKEDVIELLNNIDKRLKTSLMNNLKTKKTELENLQNSYILNNPMALYENKYQTYINLLDKLEISIYGYISTGKSILNNLKNSYILNNPNFLFDKTKQQLNYLTEKLIDKITTNTNNNKNNYVNILNRLEPLNPILTIKRGYSIAKKDNKAIQSVKDVNKDDIINIEVKDGVINTKVI